MRDCARYELTLHFFVSSSRNRRKCLIPPLEVPVSKSEPVKKKRRRDGAGFSVPAAAEEIGVSYKTLRDAIELNQVRTIEFGRITRVPKAEVARLKEVFA